MGNRLALSGYLKTKKKNKTSGQSDTILKIILAKSNYFKIDILLHGPTFLVYGAFLLCQSLLCVQCSVLENTLECFLSVTGKTIRIRKELPTRHFTLGFVFSYASHSAISLVIRTRLTSGRIFNLLFW